MTTALPFAEREHETLAEWITRAMGLFGFTELSLAVVVVVLALTVPRLGNRAYGRLEMLFAPLADRPGLQVITIGVLAVLARGIFLPWLGAPVPAIHDEQSLLLQAHTYMTGHLVNPVHPFWQHFETFHVNVTPAYASMYFPGRGAPLAAGLLMANQPWVGVWLSFVLMCMAAVWMLQGWVSRPMAFLGGVIVVTRLGVFSYWVNSYWGGAFTALGAMLVIGALPRILKEPRWGMGLLMGVGAFIMLTTRPYEGVLLCLPVALLLLGQVIGKPGWTGGRMAFTRVALPVVLMAAGASALVLVYDKATTGDAFKSPYSLNREAYAYAPAFLTSPPVQSAERGPPYFRTFYEKEAVNYSRRSSPAEIARSLAAKAYYSWNFYIGATFTFAFAAGLWVARRNKFLMGSLAVFMAGYALETWNFPHYTAPVFPIVLIVMMMGFEWLRGFEWRGKPVGVFLTRAMPTANVLLLILPAVSLIHGAPLLSLNAHSNPCCAIGKTNVRSRVMQQLIASPGKDLVLVKDGPANPIHYEMVYNDADIDRSEVVWAHQLGPEKDQALQRYFTGRRVWEFEWIEAEAEGYRLTLCDAAGKAKARATIGAGEPELCEAGIGAH